MTSVHPSFLGYLLRRRRFSSHPPRERGVDSIVTRETHSKKDHNRIIRIASLARSNERRHRLFLQKSERIDYFWFVNRQKSPPSHPTSADDDDASDTPNEQTRVRDATRVHRRTDERFDRTDRTTHASRADVTPTHGCERPTDVARRR